MSLALGVSKIVPSNLPIIENKMKLYGIITLAASAVLLAANIASANLLLAIQHGVNKGLHLELTNSSILLETVFWSICDTCSDVMDNMLIKKSGPK
jgi:hypothetical protein